MDHRNDIEHYVGGKLTFSEWLRYLKIKQFVINIKDPVPVTHQPEGVAINIRVNTKHILN